MRQKFLVFTALICLILLLVGLNAVSYVQKEKTPDSETNPNRSTFNTGATGTRAFYDLLAETGRRVVRWQEPPSALLAAGRNQPQTFVVIGKTRRAFDEKEIEELLRWVSAGGKLVVIDREPPEELIKTTANWKITTDIGLAPPFLDFDPSDPKQMTEKTDAARPSQPTVYTNQVNAVQPSRFASSINFERFTDTEAQTGTFRTAPPPPKNNFYQQAPPPPPPPRPAPANLGSGQGSGTGKGDFGGIQTETETDEERFETSALAAPVAHLADGGRTLLADFPFGSGRIVFLTDPYIVSNGGISLVDNAQLAINIVAPGGDGITAFDEFHQGYGAGESRLFAYFAGTPLVAVLWQLAALVGLILFTQSRRFARPLPEVEPNRLSKLEYVAAMAELQQRTRAFDLAVENIYTDFRRRAARLVGADNFTVSRAELARLLAERARLNQADIENLMSRCEDIIHGDPTRKSEVVQLTARLREVEEKLGLRRTRKQTFGK